MVEVSDYQAMVREAQPVIYSLTHLSNPQVEMKEFLRKHGERGASYLTTAQWPSYLSDTPKAGENNIKGLTTEDIRTISEQIDFAVLSLSFSPEQIRIYQDLKDRYHPREVFCYTDV